MTEFSVYTPPSLSVLVDFTTIRNESVQGFYQPTIFNNENEGKWVAWGCGVGAFTLHTSIHTESFILLISQI